MACSIGTPRRRRAIPGAMRRDLNPDAEAPGAAIPGPFLLAAASGWCPGLSTPDGGTDAHQPRAGPPGIHRPRGRRPRPADRDQPGRASADRDEPGHPPPDHRRLGRDLNLFATDPLAGAGLPLWLPDGAVIRAELERLAAEEAIRGGCQRVYTPVLAKRALFERSGHWAKFAGDMFPPMRVGEEEFVLRPANCPHHALVYASAQRSYRDLPVRLAELGAMFRSELSGVLGGLSRVRQINLDDTHVFCAPEQVPGEITRAVQSVQRCYRLLGIEVGPVPAVPARRRRRLPGRRRAVGRRGTPPGRGAARPRARLRGRPGRGGVLRAEDRCPGRGPGRPRGDLVHRAIGLQPASTLRSRLYRARRRQAPAGDDPPRRAVRDGTAGRLPHRARRRGVPALARPGAGGRAAGR